MNGLAEGCEWLARAGELVEEGLPAIAVSVPAADRLDALEGGGGHLLLQGGIVGELLQAGGERVEIAVGDDEAFDSIGKEVFGAGGFGGDDGALTGHGLGLDEREAFLDRREA